MSDTTPEPQEPSLPSGDEPEPQAETGNEPAPSSNDTES